MAGILACFHLRTGYIPFHVRLNRDSRIRLCYSFASYRLLPSYAFDPNPTATSNRKSGYSRAFLLTADWCGNARSLYDPLILAQWRQSCLKL
jgi:hypothetical protein